MSSNKRRNKMLCKKGDASGYMFIMRNILKSQDHPGNRRNGWQNGKKNRMISTIQTTLSQPEDRLHSKRDMLQLPCHGLSCGYGCNLYCSAILGCLPLLNSILTTHSLSTWSPNTQDRCSDSCIFHLSFNP